MADSEDQQPGSSGVSPKLIVGAVLLIVLLVFIFENTTRTKIRFIVPEVRAPLSVALLVAMVVGGIAGMLISRARRRD